MSDPIGVLRPQKRIGRTYIAIWCATTHDNRTRAPYDCIVHTKRRPYCQRCIFLQDQSWLATLQVVVSFQLIVYANIKINDNG